MKHSQATKVDLKLIREGNQVILSYQDNGEGEIEDSYIFGTMGLAGIRERVRGLDGRLKIISEKGKGFHVEIIFESILGVDYSVI